MAALQWLSKYRETGLLLIRASLGFIFIILLVPVIWNGQGSWEHFGSAMRHLDVTGHYKFWGFLGASLGIIGGVLMVRALGISPSVWHANEGHSAFLTLERVRELVQKGSSHF